MDERLKAISRLPLEGGAIVSSAACTESELFHARATNRFYVDADGLGYVWMSEYWRKIGDEANKQRTVRAMNVCAARAQSTAGGNDPQDCNWPFCGCDKKATEVLQVLIECGWGPPAAKAKWPMGCGLCGKMMDSIDDRMEFHGLGNCVDICSRCLGSGQEESGDPHGVQDAKNAIILEALQSIARNHCYLINKPLCDTCEEAAMVARKALKEIQPK